MNEPGAMDRRGPDLGEPNLAELDPRTPVLIGVGQASDPLDAPDYHRWSAVELAAEAARTAIADAGLDPAVIDTVAGVRQFEISGPMFTAPLGRSNNYPRSVAARVGAAPRRAVLEVVGGQSPQHLITEFAKAIARGEADTVLIFGSEAISTTRAWTGREDAPNFSEEVDGDLEDRGYGLEGLLDPIGMEHGLIDAPSQYALFEQARRARLGLTRPEYAAQMGALFAPFTEVASRNPDAAAPTARSADELTTVTDRNRMIADPYPRFLVARDQVNQGAAVVLTSVGAAAEAGVSPEKWVFLHGYSDLREKNLFDRPDLSVSPASVAAALLALQRAGVTVTEVDRFDLYSCFPIPVFNICDGLGLSPTDPRGLTVTGGLPFFGGAGNNYSMHAVASMVELLRAEPGSIGFVGANGGSMSKYSVGVYSTTPRPFEQWSDAEAQTEMDAAPSPVITPTPEGDATVETYTVKHDKRGMLGIVVGRLADGSRFVATTAPEDDGTVAALTDHDPMGASVQVTTEGRHAFVSIGAAGAALEPSQGG